jgi:Major Facilitator Superfamily
MVEDNKRLQKTRSAFMWTWICNTPFWAIYSMLPFILYKDLNASPLQITAIIALKPFVSIFSLYWSVWINKRKDRLRSNVMWATLLGHIPFFLYPFIDNPWFFVISFGFYMMMARGALPAWMEILKINIPGVSREKIFAYASAFEYVGGGVLPFALGWLLDGYFQSWRWIFPSAAFIALLAAIFQYRIPIIYDKIENSTLLNTLSFREQLLRPWKNAWELIQRRPDFTKFQIGFMLGGSGLILMQPALPHFFLDVLKLSYMELAVALTLCKGVGFALTSPLWVKWINKVDIFKLCSWVTVLACLFPIFLVASKFHLGWLYVAYLCYGVMQAGSELSWNMSGPIFSKNEDSSVYSSINVMTVGIRGCFIPAIGTLLSFWTNATGVMVIGGILCLLATFRMANYSRQLVQKVDVTI